MTNLQIDHAKWRKEFECLEKRLLEALEGMAVEIRHVGSTAIPGLPAKPILDIDIIIDDKNLLHDLSARLEKQGYQNKGEQGIAGRFAFRQRSPLTPLTGDNTQWPAHHLYVCFSDSLALKNHLLFRDALLRDEKLVEAYSQLKRELVSEEGLTREMYTRKKTGFILSVLAKQGCRENELDEIRKANL